MAVAIAGLLGVGCADAFLVEVGEGHIAPIVLERAWLLAPMPVASCPSGRFEVPDPIEPAEVDVRPVGDECSVDFRVPRMTLLRRELVAKRAEEIEAQGDIDSLRGLDLVVEDLLLTELSGEPFDLSAVESLAISIDGQTVLEREGLERIRAGERARISLSQAFVERFIAVLEERRELSIELGIRMVVRPRERALPPTLRLRAVLQPVLLVDALAAKL